MPTSEPVADKQDLLRAFDYCLSFFRQWNKEGRLRDNRLQAIVTYYEDERKRLDSGQATAEPMRLRPAGVCWSCRDEGEFKGGFCLNCGAPVQTAEVQRLHYLVFLCHEIKKHEHACPPSYLAMHDLLRGATDHPPPTRPHPDAKRIPIALVADAPLADAPAA